MTDNNSGIQEAGITEERRYSNKFTVPILKEVLQKLGLPTLGLKADLIKRLNDDDPSGQWMDEAIKMSTASGAIPRMNPNSEESITERIRHVPTPSSNSISDSITPKSVTK